MIEPKKEHRLILFKKGIYHLTKEITPEFLEEKYQNMEDWKHGFSFCDWDNHQDFKMNILLTINFEFFNRELETQKMIREEEEKRENNLKEAVLTVALVKEERQKILKIINRKINELEKEFDDYHPESENNIIHAKWRVLNELKEELQHA